jgi:hypothetical protein
MRTQRLLCVIAALLCLATVNASGQTPASNAKFGVIIEGTNSYHAPAYPEVVNAHLGWVRLHGFWRFIEKSYVLDANGQRIGGCSLPAPTLAQCDWRNLDSNVNDAVNRGRSVYIGMGFWAPQWANGTEGQVCAIHADDCAGNPPLQTRYWTDFVKALVNRYKNRVQYYALWNEPDYNSFWNDSAANFVEKIIKPGADAVRAVYPAAKVIGGEISDSNAMLLNVLTGGGCAKLDIVAVHLFKYNVDNNTNHLLSHYIPTIDAQCGNTKPVWVTAFGFPTSRIATPVGTDPLVYQATLYKEQFAKLDAIPRVQKIIFFTMVDNANDPGGPAILRDAANNYARKPSFYAVEQYLPVPQMVWVEDNTPTGAMVVADTDGWSWVTTNPAPVSGTRSHQSAINAGLHQHYFHAASSTLAINVGDILVAYVYLDPLNPPSMVALQWNDGSFEHRAYWGTDNLPWGANNTPSRRFMGALPELGKWVRLEVPAISVGLEGRTLNGMAFTLFGGRATWDRAGKRKP